MRSILHKYCLVDCTLKYLCICAHPWYFPPARSDKKLGSIPLLMWICVETVTERLGIRKMMSFQGLAKLVGTSTKPGISLGIWPNHIAVLFRNCALSRRPNDWRRRPWSPCYVRLSHRSTGPTPISVKIIGKSFFSPI